MTTGHTPSWQVVGVFDPDGTGADFAYTVGLIDAGAPAELHTWARPTDGLDPGDDWAFSLRDRQSLLNLHGRRAIDGLLRPGDTWTDHLDGGFTVVRWVVAEPVEAPALDTFQAPDGAPVWPLRFSLERARPTPGEPLPMPDPDVVAREARRLADGAPAREQHWDARRPRAFAPAPAHGPWAPVIAELRSIVDALRAEVDVDVVIGTVDVAMWISGRLSILRAAARAVGRVEVLEALADLAEADARAYAERAGFADPETAEGLASHTQTLLVLTYSAWAVADALTPRLLHTSTSLFDLVADPEGSTERFGQTWDRAGRPTRRVDATPDARPPHDVWAACARAAVMGAGAPVVPELLPEWYDAVGTGGDAADGDPDRAIEAVLATLDIAVNFVPD